METVEVEKVEEGRRRSKKVEKVEKGGRESEKV